MKKIKNLFILTLVVVVALMSTACGTNQDIDTKLTTEYCMKSEDIFYTEGSANDFSFTEVIEAEDVAFVDLYAEATELATFIEKDLFDYLVNEYGLEWKFVPTKIVAFDFSTVSNGEYSAYAAMADPGYKTVYINTLFIQNQVDLAYRLAHELIHCFIYYNEGSMGFFLENSEGHVIGHYTGEAFTDLIAADFLETIGEENPLDYFLNGSGYCYTVVAVQVLEHSIPDCKKMYLQNNMQDFHQALKALGEEHIADGNQVDYGELFLFQADMNLRCSQNLLFAETTAQYNAMVQDFINTLLGNYEIALGVSDGLEIKEEQQVFGYIEHLFNLEGRNEQVDQYLEYWKSCLD